MTNKAAFITGSAKRIGAATARRLHEESFDVVIHCNQSTDAANHLAEQLNTLRANSCKVVQGDITDMNALASLAEQACNAFGRLDVLVNNASAFYPTPLGHITLTDWHALVGSNMQAPLFLSQFCHKQLAANQGVIINMVDIHAERPLKDHTVYCMAKSALVTMTHALAQDLAPEVRVNGVAPGAILWPEQPLSEADKRGILDSIPLGRCGTPEDIADTIAFLVNAHYITGQIIAVDGGRSIASSAKA